MTANQQDELLMHRLRQRGINASLMQARVLRLAQATLHRWDEEECGTSSKYGSYHIERDEATGQPYRCVIPNDPSQPRRRHLISDKEAAAIARVTRVCAELGCRFYHQSDPRGCSLYVSTDPLSSTNYTNGIACCI